MNPMLVIIVASDGKTRVFNLSYVKRIYPHYKNNAWVMEYAGPKSETMLDNNVLLSEDEHRQILDGIERHQKEAMPR